MISREDILKLAALSRLKLSDTEITKMQTDMDSILGYVNTLTSAQGTEIGPVMSVNRNVLRDDANPHEGGAFTEALLALAPKQEKTKDGLYVKVKKILGGSQ